MSEPTNASNGEARWDRDFSHIIEFTSTLHLGAELEMNGYVDRLVQESTIAVRIRHPGIEITAPPSAAGALVFNATGVDAHRALSDSLRAVARQLDALKNGLEGFES
jgi:hypothetical protein